MDNHANFAYSTVLTAPSPAASGTTLVVASGHGALFPAAPFNCTVWPTAVAPVSTNAEIIRVTAVAGDTLTIVRAQEGTSARTIVAGDQIANSITAKVLTDIEAAVASIGVVSVDNSISRGNGTTAVQPSGWTIDDNDQASATVGSTRTALTLTASATGGTALNLIAGDSGAAPLKITNFLGFSAAIYYSGAANITLNAPETAGTLALTSQITDLGVASGTYTPTRSAESNLDANAIPSEAQYSRIGNTVTVSGRFTANPTAAATTTSFEMSLPVASNFGAVEDAAGVAFCGDVAGMGAAITASVANNTAVVTWTSSDLNSNIWSYTYTYQVI